MKFLATLLKKCVTVSEKILPWQQLKLPQERTRGGRNAVHCAMEVFRVEGTQALDCAGLHFSVIAGSRR